MGGSVGMGLGLLLGPGYQADVGQLRFSILLILCSALWLCAAGRVSTHVCTSYLWISGPQSCKEKPKQQLPFTSLQ